MTTIWILKNVGGSLLPHNPSSIISNPFPTPTKAPCRSNCIDSVALLHGVKPDVLFHTILPQDIATLIDRVL